MSDLTVAVIAGGSALLGATVGSATQLVVQWRQQVETRAEVQRQRRSVLYGEFCHFVLDIPSLLFDATIAGGADGAKLLRDQCIRRYDGLRADLLMSGSREARVAVEEVRVSIVSAFDEYDARGKIELAKDIKDRIGIDDITRQLWAEHVVPALKRAADIMSSEV